MRYSIAAYVAVALIAGQAQAQTWPPAPYCFELPPETTTGTEQVCAPDDAAKVAIDALAKRVDRLEKLLDEAYPPCEKSPQGPCRIESRP
jgi:hypothetical protein